MLPNTRAAEIPIEKVRDYLLSTTHPVGRFKAAYFSSLGFNSGNPEQLLAAIRKIVESEAAFALLPLIVPNMVRSMSYVGQSQDQMAKHRCSTPSGSC